MTEREHPQPTTPPALSRRRVLQVLGAAVTASHLSGLTSGAAPAEAAAAAVQSPPSYAAIVGLL